MPNDTETASVVVVGGGLAGVRTCEELRRQGFDGAVTLVSAETGPPYDRPPLSKGRDGVERADLRIDLDALDVQVLAGARATGLEGHNAGAPGSADDGSAPGSADGNAGAPGSADDGSAPGSADGQDGNGSPLRVTLDSASHPELPADAVVVATGASPIVPQAWPQDEAIRVLRTKDDAVHLWSALDAAGPSARVAVLGGSWIGMEFATVARGLGAAVTIYERAAWLLPMLPPEAGRAVGRWCDAAGVTVHLGAAVDGLEVGDPTDASARRITVHTASSAEQFDLVLVALGVAPNTSWLHDTGLPTSAKGALKVDAHLRSRDPRIVGVGDAVERWSPRYQQPLPAGHWQDARDEPVVAATSVIAALAGRTETSELGAPYDAVPYFWSEIFGHTIQFSGFVPDYRVARMVVRGSLSDATWTLCWLDARDRLQAVLACDRPRDAITARKALAADPEGLPTVDPALLADADTPLAASLQPAQGNQPAPPSPAATPRPPNPPGER